MTRAMPSAAARRSFDDGRWSGLGFAERGAILHRLADSWSDNAEALAICDSRYMGKPSAAPSSRTYRAALNFRFFRRSCASDHGRRAVDDSGYHATPRYEPAGVVAAIAPWNFP